jgi:[histone H3]-lysine4 N-trimethyltransferase MLL3
MKVDWKTNVYLARSNIEGLGLFASRELEKNTMIIEYVGELIRNEVANNRERVYEMMVRPAPRHQARTTSRRLVSRTKIGDL